jgi:Holliday junction resolvase-like predicted endonuclease
MKATGSRNQMTGRAGEYFVAAELNRKGAYAVTFAGNMPGVDIAASNVTRTRTVFIQVKTRRAGTWQTTIDKGKLAKKKDDETHFWVFVNLEPKLPEYYIVPEWWIQRDIYNTHHAYLKKHGGKRAHNSKSKHHSIKSSRIEKWKDRWGELGII